MKNPIHLLLPVLLAVAPAGLCAQTYQVGDLVTEVTSFVDRATGQPVPLAQLEGRVLFIDFFAVWCPVCNAAAPQILEEIDRWYEERGGNPDGVPMLHIGANLQADTTFYEPRTTAFVEQWEIPLVIQDTSRQLQGRFGPTSGQPTFAIINGVAGSPSHRQWELLYARFSYRDSVNSRPIEDFRAAIDSVRAAPPQLRDLQVKPDGTVEFRIEGTARNRYRVQQATRLGEWITLETPVPAAAAEPYQLPASGVESGFFRVIVTE